MIETNAEVLDDGLRTEKQLAGIMRKYNYTDNRMRKYLNMEKSYSDLLDDVLLKIGYCAGECWDIFNYCFRKWYFKNILSNSKTPRTEVIQQFLRSDDYRWFNVRKYVSYASAKDQWEILGYYHEVRLY